MLSPRFVDKPAFVQRCSYFCLLDPRNAKTTRQGVLGCLFAFLAVGGTCGLFVGVWRVLSYFTLTQRVFPGPVPLVFQPVYGFASLLLWNVILLVAMLLVVLPFAILGSMAKCLEKQWTDSGLRFQLSVIEDDSYWTEEPKTTTKWFWHCLYCMRLEKGETILYVLKQCGLILSGLVLFLASSFFLGSTLSFSGWSFLDRWNDPVHSFSCDPCGDFYCLSECFRSVVQHWNWAGQQAENNIQSSLQKKQLI